MNERLVCRLLGQLTGAFSLILLVPLLAACVEDQENIYVFLASVVCSGGLSYALYNYGISRPNQRLRNREALVLVGCGWLMICLLGALPYLWLGTMDPITALFESVSGFTTTGITAASSYDDFPKSILVWRCLTSWCGGIGVIMLFIIIMPQVSGGTSTIFNAEVPGGFAERTLPRIRKSAAMLCGMYLALTCVEVLLLLLGGVPFYRAFNLAVATMSTGGFSFYHEDLVSFSSAYVQGVAMLFMLIASISFPLYYRIFQKEWQSLREESEYKYYLAILGIAALLISVNLYLNDCADTLLDCCGLGLFHAIAIGSTTGFATADFSSWPSFSRYVLLTLMFIGGCSGSPAGGIKVSRMVVLGKAAWGELVRILHPNIVSPIKLSGRTVEPGRVSNITRFFFLYILGFVVLTLLISLTGLSMFESLGVIASCLSSVGPAFGSLGPTSTYAELSLYGRTVIIMAMLLGRLEFFTLLVILQPEFWNQKQNW